MRGDRGETLAPEREVVTELERLTVKVHFAQ